MPADIHGAEVRSLRQQLVHPSKVYSSVIKKKGGGQSESQSTSSD